MVYIGLFKKQGFNMINHGFPDIFAMLNHVEPPSSSIPGVLTWVNSR